MEKIYENNLRGQRGITLIALVITIIILLILAAVTIATLTGENGILTQAGKAKTETNNANIEEQVKLAFLGSYGTDGKLDYSELQTNLNNIEGMTGVPNTITEGSFPLTVTVNGEEIKIFDDGTIFNSGEWDKTASDEDCFYWESDDPNNEEYGTVIGYTAKIENYTKLKYPSRCTKITFSSDLQYKVGISSFTSRAFTNNILKVEIPGTVNIISDFGYSLYNISFQKLETVVIEDGVESIGSSAFGNCSSLINIEIPNSVTSIGSQAFYGCTSLKNIAISKYVSYIGVDAFGNCTSLSNIIIWQNVEEVSYRAFYGWENTQTINIEASQVPSGWDSDWNYGCNANIVYAYTGE